jgi:hypothetical protein
MPSALGASGCSTRTAVLRGRPPATRLRSKDPFRPLVLVFPNGEGNPESHANIANLGFYPLLIACGICEDSGKKDEEGNSRVMIGRDPVVLATAQRGRRRLAPDHLRRRQLGRRAPGSQFE